MEEIKMVDGEVMIYPIGNYYRYPEPEEFHDFTK